MTDGQTERWEKTNDKDQKLQKGEGRVRKEHEMMPKR